MSKKVQEINAKLTGDNTDLVQSLDKASAKIKSTAKTAERETKEAGKKMNDALAGVGTWALDKGVEKFGQMLAWANSQLGSMADVGKKAMQYGLDPVIYQKLAATAEASGYGIADAVAAYREWAAVLSAARGGNQRAIDTLTAIGTSVEALNGLDPWEAFTRSIPQAEEFAARLDLIFGDRAKAGKGFQDFLRVAAEASNTVYSAEQVEAAVRYREQIERLNSAFTELTLQTGAINALIAAVGGLNAALHSHPGADRIESKTAPGLWNKMKSWGAALMDTSAVSMLYNHVIRRNKLAPTMGESLLGVDKLLSARAWTPEELAAAHAARGSMSADDAESRSAAASAAYEAVKAADRQAEAERVKSAAIEARKLAGMTTAQRLAYHRQNATLALQKAQGISYAEAKRQYLTSEAADLQAGKLPEALVKAGITKEQVGDLNLASLRMLKAAEMIGEDGFYVRRKN